MTEDTTQRTVSEHGAVSTGLVVVLVLLALGLVAAVLGVTAAVREGNKNEDLSYYSDAREQAESVLADGKNAVAAGKELCDCDVQVRDLANQMVDAARSGDADRYNELKDQFNEQINRHNLLVAQLP